MRSAFKPVWIIGAIVLCLAGVMASRQLMAPKEMIPWRTNLAAARTEAKQANKPLLVYFTAKWCGPCQKMKTTTWADPSVEAALQNFVPVKLDVDEESELAANFNVQSIPYFALIPTGGETPVKSISTYMSPEDFKEWIGR